ncbi:hypothetical protein HELRODRAFT_183794 [Helobdella robusta]|uniref:Uncharacterized protein n=1 Tax=Helobdella robusta TaxID=6412 RepID=T1FK72_HELRO|nr:hypothetical protein HELRODRAFT_183794 [Helobdella robusta]ESO10269.1 hypothetical protein HELRODRAFT_183794 [Helobdella robusta]
MFIIVFVLTLTTALFCQVWWSKKTFDNMPLRNTHPPGSTADRRNKNRNKTINDYLNDAGNDYRNADDDVNGDDDVIKKINNNDNNNMEYINNNKKYDVEDHDGGRESYDDLFRGHLQLSK